MARTKQTARKFGQGRGPPVPPPAPVGPTKVPAAAPTGGPHFTHEAAVPSFGFGQGKAFSAAQQQQPAAPTIGAAVPTFAFGQGKAFPAAQQQQPAVAFAEGPQFKPQPASAGFRLGPSLPAPSVGRMPLMMGMGGGRGKGGKGLGKVGGKPRHRKVLRDNIQGITKSAIKRLAARAGIVRLSGIMYEEVRHEMELLLENVLRLAITFQEHGRRKKMKVDDVLRAFELLDVTLLGYK